MIFNEGREKSFTLIELLMVIAIIGILSGIVLVSVANARAFARGVKRVAMLKDLSIALEIEHITLDQYPSTCGPPFFVNQPCPSGIGIQVLNSCVNPNDYVPLLVADGVMPELPHDPQESCPPGVEFATTRYMSNGIDYKIVIYNQEGCEQGASGAFADFCGGTFPFPRYWIYQTPGAVDWPSICGSQFPQTPPHSCI